MSQKYPSIWNDDDEDFRDVECAGECGRPLYPYCIEEGSDLMLSTNACSNCERLVCNPCRYYSANRYFCETCKPEGAERDYICEF